MQAFNNIKNNILNIEDNSFNILCEFLIKINNLTKSNLIKLTNDINLVEKLIEIKLMDYKIKQSEFKLNLIEYKFLTIEDWKNPIKIKLAKILIILEYLDSYSINKLIGNKSKKTYSNKEIINESSLSRNKCLSSEYKKYDESFYNYIKKTVNMEMHQNEIHDLYQIIQSEVICREKFNSLELESYKNKIIDVIGTRQQEDQIYKLFYKIRFAKLLEDKLNEPLKYLMENSWDDTKVYHSWLTHLITFVNNGSFESKAYLIFHHKIKDFKCEKKEITDEIKKKVIFETISNVGLNIKKINEITNFIINVGIYYKHSTYYKWYIKELAKIDLFEKYKNNSFEINIDNQIKLLKLNSEEEIQMFKKNIIEYKDFLLNLSIN